MLQWYGDQSGRPLLEVLSVDPAQFGPIKGLPLFLSSHILTDFVIVGLYTSVRAQGDALFCELQNKLKYAMGWNKKREESYQCNI